jgi:hypothetical protein
MKKHIFAAVFLFAISFVFGAEPAAVTKTAAVATATVQEIAPEVPTVSTQQGKNIFEGSFAKIYFDIKTAFQNDGSGNIYTNVLGIKTRQTLFENFTAESNIRFIKPMSNQNLPVVVEMLTGKFEYVNDFFKITAGRVELTKSISSLNYFGPYATAGQRYLDLIGVSIPFFLKAGVPEIQEFDLPPLSLSLYYFPSMFDLVHSTYDGSQEYWLTQIRANMRIADSPVQIFLNLGKSSANYFNYSIVSSNVSADVSFSADLAKHVKIYGAFGAMNTNLTSKTSVVAGGFELHDFKAMILVIDEIIFETQLPLAQVTGVFEPNKFPWFLSVKNKIGKFRYGVALTTGVNDYTFAKLVSNRPDFVGPFGSGNVYAPEGITFVEKQGGTPAWYGYVGYEF